jgi:diguanylate cyclase (GGDEF)-like protein
MTSLDNKITIDQLLEFNLFEGEEPEVIEWLVDTCQIKDLQAGERLLEPGQKNNILYLVYTGRLMVELQVDGMPTLDYIEPNDCVGEMSVLDGTTTSASITAETDCRLFGIKDVHLWSLIDRSHVVARNLLKTLCSRVRSEHVVITRNFQLQQTFEKQSKVDSLTGLYNRRWLDDSLERWTGRDKSLSLMMLDIDHFKQYNDTQGHLAGDSVIHTVAHTIADQLRPTDLAARYGGEEFVALLPDANREVANTVAERVCNAIRNKEISFKGGAPLPGVTISIGIAEFKAGQSKDALLAAADAALYRAKNAGRDRVSN